jgi:hypothetical protein
MLGSVVCNNRWVIFKIHKEQICRFRWKEKCYVDKFSEMSQPLWGFLVS